MCQTTAFLSAGHAAVCTQPNIGIDLRVSKIESLLKKKKSLLKKYYLQFPPNAGFLEVLAASLTGFPTEASIDVTSNGGKGGGILHI